MFDTHYKFNYIDKKLILQGALQYKEHKFTFTCSKNNRYIVNVEEYDHNVFVIKFHLNAHSGSRNKYSILVKTHNASPVIRTCIEIMLFIYRKNPYASFGFIGANLIKEVSHKNTKRFRLYRKIMENLFSPIHFSHYKYVEKSAYLLLNRDNQEKGLIEKIETLFKTYYNF